MLQAAYFVPAFPLIGFVLLALFGSKLKPSRAGWLGTALAFCSFGAVLVTLLGYMGRHGRAETLVMFDWFPMLGVRAALYIDPLSLTMALFVTGVGSLIHLYAIGYMHGDPRFSRFFVYLNLFLFSMIMLILGDSFLLLFLGWEGVGTCSYLLISFWFERETAATAGKKAFITNRVGDVGFMIAMFLIFTKVGNLSFSNVFHAVEHGAFSNDMVLLIGIFLMIGAAGKSAQLPLYVWLPDAMEGPTPVSALIHAATMVTAGVYLMCRVNPFWGVDSRALVIVAIIGAATALFAATIACAQDDIKKVLAYSTISQLGYMFLAVGSGAYVAAIFHMITHAFFKALLFLGAGSVIHGMGDEQNMKKMGNLRKFMPITFFTFMIGWVSISGVPPFSGFWSKDEILLGAFEGNGILGKGLYLVGLVAALLTAYYMTRQIALVFFGKARWGTEGGHSEAAHLAANDEHGSHHGTPHESPALMWIPLVVLGVLSAVGGALNLPGLHTLGHWLEPVFVHGHPHHTSAETSSVLLFMAIAVAVAVAGILLGWFKWSKQPDNPALEPALFRRGWYYDSALARLFGGPGRAMADALAFKVDAGVVDGAVNGVAAGVQGSGNWLRRFQNGHVRSYALSITAGVFLVLAFAVAVVWMGVR